MLTLLSDMLLNGPQSIIVTREPYHAVESIFELRSRTVASLL